MASVGGRYLDARRPRLFWLRRQPLAKTMQVCSAGSEIYGVWAAVMQRRICLGCVGHYALRFCGEMSTHTKNAVWADARTQF